MEQQSITMPAKTTVPKAKTTGPKKVAKSSGPKKVPFEKAHKKAPVKKAPKKVPVVTEAPVPASVPTEPVVSDTPYAEEFNSLVSALDTTLATVRDLKSRLQKLAKQVHREHKAQLRKSRGRKKRVVDPNAEPSGFAKPGPVSGELRKFLSLGSDETIARTAVTQRINAYCKENNLQDPSDKRKIVPDAPLRKLLKMSKSDELTFFNLQKYMKVHFPNKDGVFPTA
jgi:chromatin remodeling complex protein RSC6